MANSVPSGGGMAPRLCGRSCGGGPGGPGGGGGASGSCPECPPPETVCDQPSSSSGFSPFPVRYTNGEVLLVEEDLSSNGFGLPWGHTRSYSNLVTGPSEGINGASWFIKEVPYLGTVNPSPLDPNQATIVFIGIINDALWWDYSSTGGGTYIGRFFIQEKLIYDSVNKVFIVRDPDGQVWKFFDFSTTTTPAKRGRFKSFTDAFGRETTATYDGTTNLIIGFEQVAGAKTSKYEYSYYGSGVSTNRLQYVTLIVDGVNVRRAEYQYHDGSDSFGSANDLKLVQIWEWDGSGFGNLISTRYYRYYKTGDHEGFAHGLKFVLSSYGYNLMVAQGYTPEIALDSQVAAFAKHAFRYHSDQSVKEERVNGGSLVYAYDYASSGNTDGFNNWKKKTTEYLPDGNRNILYTNFAGQVILKVFVQTILGVETPIKWYEYQEYDGQGRVVLKANSSAVQLYSELTPDLVTLQSSTGLIFLWEYYTSTFPSGAAPGFVRYAKVKQGSSGSPITIKEWKYVARTVGSHTIYKVSDEISYQDAAGGGTNPSTTSYSYTWKGTTFQVDKKTTTWPIIPTSMAGSGTADSRQEAYNDYGQVLWELDERGYITGYTYDASTGALIQKVEDSNSASAPWTPLAGTHFNYTTDYTIDGLGRMVQELGPTHSIDISGTSTSIRRARWIVYDDVNYEEREGQGYRNTATTADTLINPVKIAKRDQTGRITDEISATRGTSSGKLDPTDSFPQTSWVRWTHTDYGSTYGVSKIRRYFAIPSSGDGSEGTNYNEQQSNYDVMRRLVRERGPEGTITRYVLNPMGWQSARWQGTNDIGATNDDPSGGPLGFLLGNNMVLVEANLFDGGVPGGDGNLTQQAVFTDVVNFRLTLNTYDFRNRLTGIEGEEDFYEQKFYDNLDRVFQVDRRNQNASGNLVARTTHEYDPLGRVFRRLKIGVDPVSGTLSGLNIGETLFYDPSGRLQKTIHQNTQRLFTKLVFDAVGRVAKEYKSWDATETAYLDNVNVSGDTVLTQIENSFDEASNLIQVTTRARFHDATGTNELTSPSGAQPKARVSYVAHYSDALGRTRVVADYGTNAAGAFTRSATIPARSDTVLVTSTDYNDRGEAFKVTDPKAKVDEATFDDAGRLIKQVENVTGTTGPDQNKTTEFTYTPDDQVKTLKAVNSTTGNQTTTYTYGTTTAESDVARNDLLRRVTYPDGDSVEFKYNRVGQQKEKKDQNGTVHLYEYDKLGRLSHDRINTLGAGINGSVLRISRVYEVRGLLSKVTSYDNGLPPLGNVVNEVLLEYNELEQPLREYQSHAGPVNTSSTPKVSYGYSSSVPFVSRLTRMTYPDGRQIDYNYGAGLSTEDVISRIGSISDTVAGTVLVDYKYVGLDWSVEANSPQLGARMSFIKLAAEPVGDGGDQYTGWDRFRRVIDMRWLNGANVDIERVQYGFDRASNRTFRDNIVAGTAPNPGLQDEFYTYDGLYQIKTLDRGNLNAGRTGISGVPTFEEDFTYDPTGNWTLYVTKASGVVSLNQPRTHNPVNEINTISGSSFLRGYDAAGNMTRFPRPNNWNQSNDTTYDAWDRLITVIGGAGQTNTYDGLNRRVTTTKGSVIHYYYSKDWQILEERVGANTTASYQYVWGIRYLDDLVLRDAGATRLYALKDYFSVTATATPGPTISERYGYDAFGWPRFLTAGFVGKASSGNDWEVLYAGYRWDSQTGLYQVRNRYLHPRLGRWITRDPLAQSQLLRKTGLTEEAKNLYAFVANKPVSYTDVDGLKMKVPKVVKQFYKLQVGLGVGVFILDLCVLKKACDVLSEGEELFTRTPNTRVMTIPLLFAIQDACGSGGGVLMYRVWKEGGICDNELVVVCNNGGGGNSMA